MVEVEQKQLRFGTIAIEKGFITKEQLMDAIGIQVGDELEQRAHRRIGTILFDLGYISHHQIDEVLKEMDKG